MYVTDGAKHLGQAKQLPEWGYSKHEKVLSLMANHMQFVNTLWIHQMLLDVNLYLPSKSDLYQKFPLELGTVPFGASVSLLIRQKSCSPHADKNEELISARYIADDCTNAVLLSKTFYYQRNK